MWKIYIGLRREEEADWTRKLTLDCENCLAESKGFPLKMFLVFSSSFFKPSLPHKNSLFLILSCLVLQHLVFFDLSLLPCRCSDLPSLTHHQILCFQMRNFLTKYTTGGARKIIPSWKINLPTHHFQLLPHLFSPTVFHKTMWFVINLNQDSNHNPFQYIYSDSPR